MQDIGEGTIRRIDWTELTPIVLLLRVFNVALGMRILTFALIGWCLMTLLAAGLNISPVRHAEVTGSICQNIDTLNNTYSAVGFVFPILYPNFTFAVWQEPKLSLWLLGIVVIWTICGGMICRIVAMRLTVDESESTGNLFLFLRKRGTGLISSFIILSLGILCCFIPIQIACMLATVPVLNYAVAIFLPIPLLFAFFAVMLTLGLAVGWMLLFAAVSVDGSDGFDAISRMFSYVFQRPLHYLLYWLYCGILGCLGFLLVLIVCCPVAYLCHIVLKYSADSVVTSIVVFWMLLIMSIPYVYVFAWFWTSSVAIYLLLRRSVDSTPFHDVYRVLPLQVRSLPKIKPDEHGAPEIVPAVNQQTMESKGNVPLNREK